MTVRAWIPALMLLAACEGGDDTDTDTDMAMVGCADDPRALVFAAGLRVEGDVLAAELVSADPAPPARGDNAWTVRLLDAGDQPLAGATLVATPTMPDHGHGSSKVAVVTDQGDGTYTIDPLAFTMPGYWEIALEVTAGEVTDTLVYGFCIEG